MNHHDSLKEHAYVPECWLHEGDNTFVVYNEDGKTPQLVTLQTEAAASRDIV